MDYKEFLTIAKEYGFTNVQIIENTKDSNEITVNNGKLDLSTKGFSITYTIKAEYKNKTVTTYICGTYKRYGSEVCNRNAIKMEELEELDLIKIILFKRKMDI